MSRFWKTVSQWLVALLLGAFLFQALAASASELCRFQCQKDWKTNTALLAESNQDITDRWSSFSTPCPDLPVGLSSASAEADGCSGCGLCALNPVFTVQQNPSQMDLRHSPRPLIEPAQNQAWLNGGLFKPPRG